MKELLEKILDIFGLKIIRPIKHESEMDNQELLYHSQWAVNVGFNTLAKDFLKELEKRGLVKKQ